MNCLHPRLQYHEINGVTYVQTKCPDCDMRFDPAEKPEEFKPTKEQIEQSKKDHELVREMLSYPRCACHDKLIEHCPIEQERRYDAFWGKPSRPLEGYTKEEIDEKLHPMLEYLKHQVTDRAEEREFRRELLDVIEKSFTYPPDSYLGLEDLRKKYL